MTRPGTLYSARRRRLIAYGQWESSIVDAHHVIAHLRELVAEGRSYRWISRASGVSDCIIRRLDIGGATRITRANARRILSVGLDRKPSGKTWVPGVGTKRRVEALATLGWSQPAVAAEAGLHQQTLSNAVTDPTRVAADTAAAVARAYERLRSRWREDRAGAWVRARAARLGFAPPGAWSRYTIDDPGAGPLESAAA